MQLDFYFWSYQCPLNGETLRLLQEYRDRLQITLHDISDDAQTAREQRMFFPTLTVVNGTHRFFSPLHRSFLETLCGGTVPEESPYRPPLGTRPLTGTVVPLTEENFALSGGCTGCNCAQSCSKKLAFLKEQGLSTFGFLNLGSQNKLLGGAECLPSSAVPYAVPKDKETAFVTCVYLSRPDYDTKRAPLQALEKHLAGRYHTVEVLSDETGIFPNGDLRFFTQQGYQDAGILSQKPSYCTIHLLTKNIEK
ncbi:MAG: hypothetical protein LKF71_01205 [Oscillospiraceae bacterium]|jgi:hypothetical protein|nr:hypothetical protein [Oscillospiraceae bacterium]